MELNVTTDADGLEHIQINRNVIKHNLVDTLKRFKESMKVLNKNATYLNYMGNDPLVEEESISERGPVQFLGDDVPGVFSPRGKPYSPLGGPVEPVLRKGRHPLKKETITRTNTENQVTMQQMEQVRCPRKHVRIKKTRYECFPKTHSTPFPRHPESQMKANIQILLGLLKSPDFAKKINPVALEAATKTAKMDDSFIINYLDSVDTPCDDLSSSGSPSTIARKHLSGYKRIDHVSQLEHRLLYNRKKTTRSEEDNAVKSKSPIESAKVTESHDRFENLNRGFEKVKNDLNEKLKDQLIGRSMNRIRVIANSDSMYSQLAKHLYVTKYEETNYTPHPPPAIKATRRIRSRADIWTQTMNDKIKVGTLINSIMLFTLKTFHAQCINLPTQVLLGNLVLILADQKAMKDSKLKKHLSELPLVCVNDQQSQNIIKELVRINLVHLQERITC